MNDTAVLHIALEPVTGPLSVIRTLARAQKRSGAYTDVGVGVIASGAWRAKNGASLLNDDFRFFHFWSPPCFGTLSFLLQRVRRPPIERWATQLAASSNARRVVVHFHNAWLSGAFLPLRASGVPLRPVVTFHGFAGEAALRRQPVRRWIHRCLAATLKHPQVALTSVDRHNLAAVESLLGLPAGRFAILPNGAPAQPVTERPFLRGAGCLTVAQVGALTPQKGWRQAAEAVIALNAARYPTRLWIAGEGPDVGMVRQLAGRYPGTIDYLGKVDDPVENLLPKCDVLTLLTTNDGMPMVILEAMSCGLPPVTTRVGGIPDVVANEMSGLLIEPTQAACEQALRRFHECLELLGRLGQGARAYFETNLRIEKVVGQYHKIY